MKEIEKNVRIRIKRSPHGPIEEISSQEFQALFGVQWAAQVYFPRSFQPQPKVPAKYVAPPESERAQRKEQYGLALGQNDHGNAVDALKRYRDWLYADSLRNCEVADVYLQKVNDTVGYGVFANSDIKPGDLIGEYSGLVCDDSVTRHDDDISYCHDYPYMRSSASIDAKTMGNYTRFINHSHRANCSTMRVFVDGISRLAMIATCPIERGHQLLFYYGSGYWLYRRIVPADISPDSIV